MRADGEAAFKVVADGKDLLEHTCHALRPVTTYHFYVDTYNLPSVTPGAGPRTGTVTCETGEAAPEEPPRNLRVAETTLDSVRVQWEPPAATNGAVVGYRLFQDTVGQDEYVPYDRTTVRPATLRSPPLLPAACEAAHACKRCHRHARVRAPLPWPPWLPCLP